MIDAIRCSWAVSAAGHWLRRQFVAPFESSRSAVATSAASTGRIDCYKRGHFVLEAKKIKLDAASKGFDDALQRARGQAEGYARALPAAEGRPPFIVTVDVGNVLEIYAEFSHTAAR